MICLNLRLLCQWLQGQGMAAYKDTPILSTLNFYRYIGLQYIDLLQLFCLQLVNLTGLMEGMKT